MSDYVVIAGLSGAGRSQAANDFEDLGWFVIDNLPPALMSKVSELADAPGSSMQVTSNPFEANALTYRLSGRWMNGMYTSFSTSSIDRSSRRYAPMRQYCSGGSSI